MGENGEKQKGGERVAGRIFCFFLFCGWWLVVGGCWGSTLARVLYLLYSTLLTSSRFARVCKVLTYACT